MKRALVAIALLLLSFAAASAEPGAKPSDPYHDWFTYYYLYQDSAKVPDFLKWLEESGTLEKIPQATPPMEGFLSVVFAANPSQVNGWVHGGHFTGKTQAAVDYAAKPPVAPEKKEVKTADDLDMAWASFFASGNDLYLQKIVGVLDKDTRLLSDTKKDAITRAAAAWSLGSNMTQHEAVDRFLSGESEKRTGAVGDTLKSIVANVRKQREARAFPHSDGEFSAIMFVTDPAVAEKEFADASDNILHFKEIAHAKVGDKRTLVIVFAGQQLTPDYLADVTYDEQLKDPAGKVYSNEKGLEAIKGKLPTRFRIYHNKAAVFIAFDKKDKPGIYKVSVLLKDNIGNKSIPLMSQITFRR